MRGLFSARMGPKDPTHALSAREAWYATWTPEGAATLRVEQRNDYELSAWGPGAAWLLAQAERLLGVLDAPEAWAPEDARIARLLKKHGSPRVATGTSVVDVVVRTICEQRVTSLEAMSAYRRIVERFGELAPGPHASLRLPPTAETLAALPYYELHECGLERNRAETLVRVAKKATFLEACRDLDREEARRRLGLLRGVGPWTVEMVMGRLGDADAAPTGDYHLPNLVAHALAGEARGDDVRMLALLEPFRPHRWRLIRLLERTVRHAPRYGPRRSPSRWSRDARY